jgi:hypothetical protein
VTIFRVLRSNHGLQVCADIPDAVHQVASSGSAVDLVFVEFSDSAAVAPLLAASAAGEGRVAVAVIGVVAAGDGAATAAAAAEVGLAGTVPKPLDRAQANNNDIIK